MIIIATDSTDMHIKPASMVSKRLPNLHVILILNTVKKAKLKYYIGIMTLGITTNNEINITFDVW